MQERQYLDTAQQSASTGDMDPEEFRAYAHQVVDWIVDRARVTDKPMTFKDLTGFGQNIERNSETNT